MGKSSGRYVLVSRTMLSKVISSSHMWLFKFQLIKIKSSVPQSLWPHHKYSKTFYTTESFIGQPSSTLRKLGFPFKETRQLSSKFK